MTKKYKALIALDWADKRHDGCLLAKGKSQIERFKLLQNSAHIEHWVAALQKRFPGGTFAIILEQKRGALITALLKYNCFDIYPVNPATVAKYREAFSPSGAKNDPTDAALMLDFLQRHSERLSVWVLEDEKTRMLRILVEQRRVLVNERKRLGNRMTASLKSYFPEVLTLFPNVGRAIISKFLLQYPTLEHAKKATEEELVKFFRKNRSARTSLITKRLEIIRTAIALTKDKATIETSSMMCKTLARQMLLLIDEIEQYEDRIEKLFSQHNDAALFKSLPASGEIMAPRLLAAFGSDRERFKSAIELQQYLGIAPVLKESGSQSLTHWRYNCHKFLRQSIHEWAGITIKHSLWARAYYAMQRQKGKTHAVAVRALAYKWIRIIFRLWKEQKPYCEATYLAALQRNGSPIMKFLAENPKLEKLRFSTTCT